MGGLQHLHDEIKRALPGLRLVVPAAAGAVWLFHALRGKGRPALPAGTGAEEEEGTPVAVDLPASARGPPFAPPPPLAMPLLDVELSVPLAALWRAAFAGGSRLLEEFHAGEGDRDIQYGPWLQKDGRRWRVLSYTTPLNKPLGPRQAFNREVMEVVDLGPSAFLLRTRCTSSGVPFSSNFANVIEWAAVATGVGTARLTVTGECRFHNPVWGPIKGQIHRESSKGMAKAYAHLAALLTARLGGSSVGGDGAAPAPGGAALDASGALLASPHTSAAALMLVLVFIILLSRFAMQQAAVAALMQGLAARS
eukprot:scaffold6.g2900.t1